MLDPRTMLHSIVSLFYLCKNVACPPTMGVPCAFMVVCFWFFLPRTLPEIEPRASSVDGIWAFECGQGVC